MSARVASIGLLALLMLLAACGPRKDFVGSPPAARVNGDEVDLAHVELLLQQQRKLRPEQSDAAGRQILERLIDQQLAVQRADEMDLDREPRVALQLEAVRREVLARAYLDKVGEAAAKPTPEEIRRYYEDKPALFAERRIYSIQEITIEARPDQLPALREQLAASRSINEFVDFLKAQDYRFSGNQAVRAAEQLPLASLEAFSRMQVGQAAIVPSAAGAQVVVLAGSRSQPVSEEQARPAIEQFLLNERRRKLVEEDLGKLRAAAKIEYVGRFAEPPAAAASGAEAASPPSVASEPAAALPASSGSRP